MYILTALILLNSTAYANTQDKLIKAMEQIEITDRKFCYLNEAFGKAFKEKNMNQLGYLRSQISNTMDYEKKIVKDLENITKLYYIEKIIPQTNDKSNFVQYSKTKKNKAVENYVKAFENRDKLDSEFQELARLFKTKQADEKLIEWREAQQETYKYRQIMFDAFNRNHTIKCLTE